MITLEEDRKKVVEAINATFSHLGAGVSDLLTDRAKLGAALAGLTLLALGVYSTREGVRVAGRTFDRWFGTPRLVGACVICAEAVGSPEYAMVSAMRECRTQVSPGSRRCRAVPSGPSACALQPSA